MPGDWLDEAKEAADQIRKAEKEKLTDNQRKDVVKYSVQYAVKEVDQEIVHKLRKQGWDVKTTWDYVDASDDLYITGQRSSGGYGLGSSVPSYYTTTFGYHVRATPPIYGSSADITLTLNSKEEIVMLVYSFQQIHVQEKFDLSRLTEILKPIVVEYLEKLAAQSEEESK